MFGFVLRRMRGRLPLAAATLVTVLITTTVLTCLQAFSRSVGETGLRAALQVSAHDRTTVLVTSTQGGGARSSSNAQVATFARTLFGSLPVTVDAVSHSRSYGLPGATGNGGKAELTQLAALAHDRVRLLSGRWPAPAPGARIEVAVPRGELTPLRLSAAALPAQVRLVDRDNGTTLTVTVTGVYRADDPATAYWRLDPFGGHEIQLNDFVNYGPMLVDDTAFTSGAVTEDGRAWLLDPDLSTIRQGDVDALRARVDTTVTDLQRSTSLTAQTDLGAELDDVRAGVRVSWSNELIGLLQLAVLAAVALLLVARLGAARQAGEDALLAARGAARGRLGMLTGGQALLLTLPAAALALPLTPLLLGWVRHSYGPLQHVPVNTSLTWQSWLVVGLCALACVTLTTVPALLRSAGDLLRLTGRRQALVGGAARSGADLALIVLAFLAYQELGHIGSDAGNGLGVDPVAVAAPSLALCAGTVVVLRLLPYAARLGGMLAARGTGLAAALVGWQLARRSGRAAGPTLLLVLAVATGVLALGEHASWSASQSDQASFATADGLRIWGSPLPALGQGGHYAALPGGDRIIPVARTTATLPSRGAADLLAVDTATTAQRLSLRPDALGGRSVRQLFTPLALPGPTGAAAGVALPGRPARIDVTVSARMDTYEIPSGLVGVPGINQRPDLVLVLEVRDRFGTLVALPPVIVPSTGRTTVSADLTAAAGAPLGQIAWPLTLAGVEVRLPALTMVHISGELTLSDLATSPTAHGPASPVPLPAGRGWTGTNLAADQGGPNPLQYVPGRGLLAATYDSRQGVDSSLTPTGSGSDETVTPVPALATPGYLDAVGAKVGNTVPVSFGTATLQLQIIGEVPAVPTAGSTALVVDLGTFSRQLNLLGTAAPEPTEWWLPAASPQDRVPAQAAAFLRAQPSTQNLQLREEVAGQLRADPLSTGPQVTLLVLSVVAAILAAIGFGAATAAAASERTREHAILLALGCPPRRLARTAAAEPAVLIALGTVVGLGVGTLILRLMVPLVVLSPTGQPPVPPVQVTLPLGETLALLAAITAVPVLTAFLSGRRSAAARPRPLEEL